MDKYDINKKAEKKLHKLTMVNRGMTTFSGIIDVLSYNEENVSLDSEYGSILVKGHNLVIRQLSLETGEVVVDGEIDCIMYGKAKKRRNREEGLVGRLFK